MGYRHIDTAQMYGNEKGVGDAVAASGLDRKDVFLTSKLNNDMHDPEDAAIAFDLTLEALGTDYVDLFLIHWPLATVSDFVETWKAMEDFYRSGRAKSIGVSNFQPHHLNRLKAEATITPAVNQIEVHPYLTQDGGARVRHRARHRHRGVEPDRAGQGAGRPDDRADRGGPGQDPRAGHAAVAPPARRHRVPQVGHPQPHRGELRDLRLRARPTWTWRTSPALNRDERTGPDPDTFDYVPS